MHCPEARRGDESHARCAYTGRPGGGFTPLSASIARAHIQGQSFCMHCAGIYWPTGIRGLVLVWNEPVHWNDTVSTCIWSEEQDTCLVICAIGEPVGVVGGGRRHWGLIRSSGSKETHRVNLAKCPKKRKKISLLRLRPPNPILVEMYLWRLMHGKMPFMSKRKIQPHHVFRA